MSSIDNRIVQMEFRHGNFLSGVSQTMRALTLLKKALNFTGVVNTDDLKLDTSGLENGLNKITGKFSELGSIGENVFGLLGNKAMEAGKKVADAFFGLNDISTGQSKYETYTKAVQTITNATGKSVEEVEEVLKDLQEYTDQTSYDFATMVSTIGKFTAVGVDLKAAELAMEGIGNEAAKSGAGIQEANHAMYNFAQALSQGSVKLQDWRSIANANMSTKEFKETLIQTAIELGVLEKQADGVGSIVTTNQEKLEAGQKALAKAQTATKDRAEKLAEAQKKIDDATKKTTVDFKTFETTLSDGWLTTDVLIKTLEKYADTSDPFGQKAYEAAQKALTFTDAIQATKDAVSSGWMDSFKYIFGNLDEAMKLWTDVSEALYDYIAIFRDWRNEILKSWHDMGGYNDMIEAASNLWQTFMNIVKGVGKALATVFPILNPENMTQALYDGTKKLKDWSAELLNVFGLQEDIQEEEEELADSAEEVADKVGNITISATEASEAMSGLSEETRNTANNLSNIETGLKRGMRGEEVKKLQKQLMNFGFRLDRFGADGIFGPETQAALKALQKEIGVAETGLLDEATKAALQSEEILRKLEEHSKKGISIGARGEDIKKLQKNLNEYLGESEKLAVDGIFGPKTEAAIKKLQKKLGIVQTGIWDQNTKNALETKKVLLMDIDQLSKALKEGMQGADVKKLQQELINGGYLDQGMADGIYGPKTREAVKKLQKALGVKETGNWDKATVVALHRAQETAKSVDATARANKKTSETAKKATEDNEKAADDADKATKHTTIAMMRLQNIVKGWSAALKIVGEFAGAVTKIAGNVLKMFDPLIDVAIRFGSVFGVMFENLAKDFDENDVYGSFVEKVTKAFGPFGELIQKVANGLTEFLDAYDTFLESAGRKNTFKSFFEFLDGYLDRLGPVGKVIKTIAGIFKFAFDKIGEFTSSFALFFGLRQPVDEAEENLLNFSKTFEYFVSIVKDSGILDSLIYAFNTIRDALLKVGISFDSVKQGFKDFFGDDFLTKLVVGLGTSLRDYLETTGYVIEVVSEIIAYIIENIPGAIKTIKDFWSALTFEGDEKTGKAPGIIGRVTKFFKDILGLTGDNEEATEYAKAGVGPISLVTGALAAETVEGEEHVNKSLKVVKGICGLIKKIFSLIRLAFTGNIGENSGLKQETIDRILAIRSTLEKIFDSIAFVFTGKITKNVSKEFIEKANSIKDVLNSVLGFLTKFFGGIFARVAYFVSGINLKDINLSDEVKKRIDSVKTWIGNIWKTLTTLFTGEKAEGLKSNIAEKALAFRAWISSTFEKLKEAFGGIFARVAYFVSGINLKDINLSDEVKKRIDSIKTWIGNIWKTLTTLFTGEKAEGLKSNIAEKALAFRAWISSTFEKLKEAFGGIFARVAYFVSGLNLKDINLSDEVKERIDSIKKWLGNIWKALTTLFTGEKAEGLKSGIAEKALAFRAWIASTFEKLKEAFGGIFARVAYFVSGLNLKDINLSDEVKKRIDGIKEWLSNIGNAISVLITGRVSERGELTRETAENIVKWRNRLFGIFDKIAKAIGPFVKNPLSTLGVLFTGKRSERGYLSPESTEKILEFRNNFVGIIDTIKGVFSSIFGSIKGLLGANGVEEASDSVEESFEKSDFKGKLIKAGVAIAGIILALKLITGKINEFKSSIGIGEEKKEKKGLEKIAASLLKIAISVGIITAAIYVLGSLMKPGELIKGVVGLGIIAAVIVGVFALLKKIGSSGEKGKNDFSIIKNIGKAIMDLASGMGILTAALVVLAKMKTETFLSGLWKLGVILGVTVGFLALLKLIKFDKLNIKGFWDLALGIEILAIVVRTLSDMSWTSMGKGLAGLAAIMLLMAGLFAVMGKVGAKKIKLEGFVEFGECIAIIGSTMKKLGKMTWEELARGILGILVVMGSIAGIIALLGHFGDKIKPLTLVALFGGMAVAIGVFGYVLKKIKGTDPKLLYAFSISLAIALGAFVAACMFVGSGTDNNRAKAMLKGAGAIAGALAIFVIAAVVIVGGLGELDRIEGLDLRGSIERGKVILGLTAEALRDFGDKLGLNLPIIAGVLAASLIVGLIPGGESALTDGAMAIAEALGILIGAAVILVGGIGELDRIPGLDLVESAKRGGEILGTVADALSKFGDKLGIDLPTIAGILVASEIVGLIPGGESALKDGATAIAEALGIFVIAAVIIVDGLGELDRIPGLELDESAQRGGEILESVAGALAKFKDTLGLNIPVIAGVLVASEIVGLIPGGSFALIKGALAISGVAGILIGALTAIVGGLGKLDEWTNGGLSAAIDKGGDVLESISTAIARVKSGFTKVYNEDLKDFGEAMKSVREGIEGVSDDGNLDDDMNAATGIAEKLHTFFSSLTPYNLTDASGFVTEYTSTASALITDVGSFGTAISDLWAGVTGISKDKNIDTDVDASIEVVKLLKTKFFDVIGNSDTMPSDDGLRQYNEKVDGILDNVKKFGENIGIFHDNVGGLSSTQMNSDTEVAIGIATTVSGFLSELNTKAGDIETNKGAIEKWFTGDTKQETVFDSIARLGQSINGSKDAFSGLSDSSIVSDVGAAVDVATATAGLLSHLGEGDVYNNIVGGTLGLDALGSMFNDSEYSLATIIKTFADQLKDIENLPSVSDIFAGFAALASILSTNVKLKDDFSETGVTFSNYILTAFSDNDVSSSSDVPNKMLRELRKKEYKDAFEKIGRNYVIGIADGVEFYTYLAEEAARNAATLMKVSVAKTLRIKSPSKVGEELGRYFIEGLAIGSMQNAYMAENSARDAASGMIGAVSNVLSNINAILAEGLDIEPVITPVVDLSNVKNAADEASTSFGNGSLKINGVSASLAASAASNVSRSQQMKSTQENVSIKELPEVIKKMTEDMGMITDEFKNLGVYLDGKILAGYMTPRLNSSLGKEAILAGRMN